VPESIEWVDDITPSLLPAVRSLGLTPHLAPLMVLDRDELGRPDPRARVLDPDGADFGEDLAVARAVQHVGFGDGGTAIGSGGVAERDAAVTSLAEADLEWHRNRHRTGSAATAVAQTKDGVLAAGALQRALNIAELVGIATLPVARKLGLGGAVTAALAHHAVQTGADTVFLSAASDDVARVYARFGFRRVGTACILG
jgi:N-acetylglutamate synthase-like GNAT family acetyltransferase